MKCVNPRFHNFLTLYVPNQQNGQTQTIRRPLPTNCLIVFDHFVGLALKVLKTLRSKIEAEIENNCLSHCSFHASFCLFLFPESDLQCQINILNDTCE